MIQLEDTTLLTEIAETDTAPPPSWVKEFWRVMCESCMNPSVYNHVSLLNDGFEISIYTAEGQWRNIFQVRLTEKDGKIWLCRHAYQHKEFWGEHMRKAPIGDQVRAKEIYERIVDQLLAT